MRVLLVTNMYPTAERPELGSFIRDQVEALRRRDDLDVDLFAFHGRGLGSYPRAARALRRRVRGRTYDVVHAHFGLTAWVALAARVRAPLCVTLHGNDLFHPRSNRITRAALPLVALPSAVSRAFSANVPGAGRHRRVAVLPVGVDLHRFRPMPRAEARERLGLDADGRYLLFPHDPSRRLKRFDRAQQAAEGATLLTMGGVPPAEVPLWVNAVNAVLVPSQDEGFGLSVIEALACGTPVLATPVGIHATALGGIPGAWCEPFDAGRWRAIVADVLADPDTRSDGRQRAGLFSSDLMAARVVAAWRELVAGGGTTQPRPILGRSRR